MWPRILVVAILGFGGIATIAVGVNLLPDASPPLASGIPYSTLKAQSDAVREAQLHSFGFYLICGGCSGFATSILYLCFIRCYLVPKWHREEQADYLAEIESAMFRLPPVHTRVRVATILPAAQPNRNPEVRWLAPSERAL